MCLNSHGFIFQASWSPFSSAHWILCIELLPAGSWLGFNPTLVPFVQPSMQYSLSLIRTHSPCYKYWVVFPMWFCLVLPFRHRKKGFVVESQTTSWWYQIRQYLSQRQKRFVLELYEDYVSNWWSGQWTVILVPRGEAVGSGSSRPALTAWWVYGPSGLHEIFFPWKPTVNNAWSSGLSVVGVSDCPRNLLFVDSFLSKQLMWSFPESSEVGNYELGLFLVFK